MPGLTCYKCMMRPLLRQTGIGTCLKCPVCKTEYTNDGKVKPKEDYQKSVEEKNQMAIEQEFDWDTYKTY